MTSPNGTTNGSTTPTLRTAIPSPRVVRISLPPEHKSFWEFWGHNDSHLIALSAFLLGLVFSGTIAAALYFPTTPQCWLYITFLCIFHFLEYFITAKYKADTVTLDGIFLWYWTDR
jgi:protein-S-isoprenylcysteine O-methyltransferase